jgi:mannose-6-phosphate isomerase-like protein (cupin superfamily)
MSGPVVEAAPGVVARMSAYTILRRADAPDYTRDAPGAFLGYGRPLGAEQLAVNVRVLAPHTAHVAPGRDPAWGHSHRTIEEVYLVLAGELTMKLDDEVETLRQYDAVLIPAATVRAVRNETDEEAAFAMISVRVEDNRAESVPHEDFWLDQTGL